MCGLYNEHDVLHGNKSTHNDLFKVNRAIFQEVKIILV